MNDDEVKSTKVDPTYWRLDIHTETLTKVDPRIKKGELGYVKPDWVPVEDLPKDTEIGWFCQEYHVETTWMERFKSKIYMFIEDLVFKIRCKLKNIIRTKTK